MRGKIDKQGHLVTIRNGRPQTQFCPKKEGRIFCGDSCKQFHKIGKMLFRQQPVICIDLCFGSIFLDLQTFSDERTGR